MDELREVTAHVMRKDQVVYAMGKDNPPALTIDSGDVVVAECFDCFGGMIRTPQDNPDAIDHDLLNPATGPVFIREAEPGDVLAVDLLDIQVAEQGAAPLYTEFGFLKDDADIGAFTKIAAVGNGVIEYREDIRIPVRAMLGTLGVAPAGDPISNLWMGDHGANMDHKDVCAGNTVYLPVYVPGGLLAFGDAHAVSGDGETAAAGLEIESVVTLRARVIKGRSLPRPLIESPTEFMTCGWGMTMEEATSCAMRDMVDLLEEKLRISRVEACNLAGLVGDARPGNAVTSPGAMRFSMPKGIFINGIELP